jgi:hypothetical protein
MSEVSSFCFLSPERGGFIEKLLFCPLDKRGVFHAKALTKGTKPRKKRLKEHQQR